MKVALAAAVAGAIGAIVATIWVGSKVREETVVANPYEQGLRHSACDAGAAACTRPLTGGGAVTLDIGPRPIRTMRELAVRVELREAPPDPRVVVAFSMPGMEMGKNEVRLGPSGPGRFEGTAVLVRCPSGRKEWTAEVRVEAPGSSPRLARFQLAAVE
jgi:hypothetical protein